MKPMPASLMQQEICSGARSMRTPSAVSTSAAPESEDAARLPCLATGTPAPAGDKAPRRSRCCRSPMRRRRRCPRRRWHRAAPSRAASCRAWPTTAPVISSTVSPRMRMAMSSPPICDGVASPTIMRSKKATAAASSRGERGAGGHLSEKRLEIVRSLCPQSINWLARWPVAAPRATTAAAARPLGRSTAPRGRGNSSGSDARAPRRCFPDGTARRAPEGAYASEPHDEAAVGVGGHGLQLLRHRGALDHERVIARTP